jgi:hypothetical protein
MPRMLVPGFVPVRHDTNPPWAHLDTVLIGKGMIGRGMGKSNVLEIIPLPVIPLPIPLCLAIAKKIGN